MEKNVYKGYKGLNVYQKAYSEVINVYKITKGFPEEEKYVMVTQMRRASCSIPLNIAEGYGKKESMSDYRRFLIIAKGSCNEMQVLIDLSKDLGYISETNHGKMAQAYIEISKMLQGLIKTIK